MGFEDILTIVGGARRYQKEVLFIMMAVKLFPGIVTIIPVFIGAKREYNCSQPYSSWNSSQRCDNGTVSCTEWSFAKDPMTSTLQSQYSLTCSNEVLADFTSTFYFLGFMVGCTLYGKISDSYGRRPSVIITTVHLWLMSLASAFMPWYSLYAVFRFLAGVGNGGLLTTLFTMASEVTDTEHRVFWATMVSQGWSIGIMLMSLVAYFVRDHFYLQLIMFSPFILSVPVVMVFVKESPRWLFVKRDTERLSNTVAYVAKRNNRDLGATFDISLFYDVETTKPRSRTFKELIALRSLRGVTLIVWLNWFVVSMSFYVVSLGVEALGGNIFLNTAILAAVEIPSRFLVVFLTGRFGRIPTLTTAFALGAACNCLNAFLYGRPELTTALITSAMVAKIGFTMAFDVVWLYSAEIFPTEIRNLGIGVGSTWARVGGTLSTLVDLLRRLWGPAPFVLLGVLPFIAALATCFLPETKGALLPETLEEGEQLAKRSNQIKDLFGCCSKKSATVAAYDLSPTEATKL